MKASIKFRDEQKPLIRAKVPLTILNVPFQSGIVSGESNELSLSLGTFFESGPAFKLAYRPNDSKNPFSFVFKTGIGHFGSPLLSPFIMSAEFNLVGNHQNPRFFIHFKPSFGDFCLKKSHSSSSLTKSLSSSSNVVGAIQNDFETPVMKTDYFQEKAAFLGSKVGLPAEFAVAGAVENLFSGTVVSAHTSFPMRNRAVVNFQWGLRFPKAAAHEDHDMVILGRTDFSGISFRQCPLLVMNKIGIEHVARDDSKKGKKNLLENADLTQACLDVKQQLETIQAENGLLRNAFNDLRAELASRKFSFPNMNEAENSKAKYSGDRRSNSDKKLSNGKPIEGDVNVNEDLKKA